MTFSGNYFDTMTAKRRNDSKMINQLAISDVFSAPLTLCQSRGVQIYSKFSAGIVFFLVFFQKKLYNSINFSYFACG